MYADLKMLIDGEWTNGTGGRREPVIDPATEEVLGELPLAGTSDLDRSLSAVQRTQAGWAATAPKERSRILRKAAELIRERAAEIARQLTLEQGKPLAQSHAEISFGYESYEWEAEQGRRNYGRVVSAGDPNAHHMVVKEPIGPVAAFTPWNFPAVLAARKMAAALAAGCTIIIKPCEETPAAPLAFARALHDAGVPPGVLNVVYGVPAEVSEHLIASDVIKKVSFTGSIPAGKHLAKLAAAGMKPTTMELGGHAPVIVFDDVDVEKIATTAVTWKYRNAGQVCSNPARYYVHHAVYERFVRVFTERAASIKVGPGLEEGTQMGPLANARRLAAMDALVRDAVDCGAELKTGGKRIGNRGYFYAPTVLADVPEKARILNEEPFGPVAPIMPFTAYDEVVERANRLPHGLTAYAFTSSVDIATRIGKALKAGLVGINHFAVTMVETPFGGVKESGYGKEGGFEGQEAYLVTKLISQVGAP